MTFFVLANKLILEIKSQERKYVWELEIEKKDTIMLIKKRKTTKSILSNKSGEKWFPVFYEQIWNLYLFSTKILVEKQTSFIQSSIFQWEAV